MSSHVWLLPLFLAWATPAAADPGRCPTDGQLQVLHAFTEKLAGTDDVAEAKRLALKKTALGHRAIDQASRMVPRSDDLAEARSELVAFEATVNASETSAEVAAAFDGLQGDQMAGCQYTTVEVVVIVIGLLFGIIPGLIFLLILC